MDLQKRVVNILTTPQEEWRVIAAESADPATLTRTYIAPLAAIPAIARFIGFSIVGVSLPVFGAYRYGIVHGFTTAVIQYVLSIAGVFIAALVIDKLAPTFRSQSSTIRSLQLVTYASTVVWLAGILNIIPALAPLGLLAALYAIYLFYLGLPVMMKTPADQVIPYMVVAAVTIIVVMLVVGFATTAVTSVFFAAPGMTI
jgi:hypothetical protein